MVSHANRDFALFRRNGGKIVTESLPRLFKSVGRESLRYENSSPETTVKFRCILNKKFRLKNSTPIYKSVTKKRCTGKIAQKTEIKNIFLKKSNFFWIFSAIAFEKHQNRPLQKFSRRTMVNEESLITILSGRVLSFPRIVTRPQQRR